MAKRPPPDPNRPFTIDLPGFNDIIQVPALEDKSLKSQRADRAYSARTPTPEPLLWISQVVNLLDDAQDILYTALVLARPILRRLPARAIPYLGWILLANDILNLGTAILSQLDGGRPEKKRLQNAWEAVLGGKIGRAKSVAKLLGPIQWIPLLLQGGQAMDTITGYGLQLGVAMGAVQDAVWGFLRHALGQEVIIRGPLPADMGSKAARFLLESASFPAMQDILSEEDHDLLNLAQAVAINEIADYVPSSVLWSRATSVADAPLPIFEPWSPSTIEALEDLKIPWQGGMRPFVPTSNPRPSVLETVHAGLPFAGEWEQTMRAIYGQTTHGTAMQAVCAQAARRAWDWCTGIEDVIEPLPTPELLPVYDALHFNVFPKRPLTLSEMQGFVASSLAYRSSPGFSPGSLGTFCRSYFADNFGGWTRGRMVP